MLVLGLHLSKYGRGIGFDRVVQDRRQRRAGVFDVGVDAAGKQGLLADVAAGEIKAPLDAQMGARLQVLRENFSEQRLLGKILRADHDRVAGAAAAADAITPATTRISSDT